MKTNSISSTLRRSLGCLVPFSVAVFSAASLKADTLALWNMQNVGTLATPSTVDPSLTVGNLTGNNLTAPVNMSPHGSGAAMTNNYIGWSRSNVTGGPDGLSIDQLLANATYFSFTITPNAGAFTLTGISFECMIGSANTAANREFFLLSDKTGYDNTSILLAGGTKTTIAGYTFPAPLIPLNTATSPTIFSVDLSGDSAFANITDSVTFRFYIGTDTVSQNIGFSQLSVQGVPVPEPSSFALISLGGFGLLAISRRFRRA